MTRGESGDGLNRRIIAHRGLWSERSEQNTPSALIASLSCGFGLETDLRDLLGQVVISHDPPVGSEIAFVDFLSDAAGVSGAGPLALNVKADGLAEMFAVMSALDGLDHFFFDMAFPDMRHYVERSLPIAVRLSEYEWYRGGFLENLPQGSAYWVDGLTTDWWLTGPGFDAIADKSRVYLVSPEVHGRDPYATWNWFAERVRSGQDLFLCTDHPKAVRELMT